ncbi:hypothetical protein SteCoe_36548 [Stentor coeruleus]|uniref:Uncharacterized protein n=1 Tax=Stentor coeruleus TaxID=5963 RepID=A0A1R2APW7_9CILI|nr:hypothetical protein SteCoe_36548 [Stentor coeruleus]
MAMNRDGFDVVKPKIQTKSGMTNLKITSGVYREDFQTRLKAYNLTPKHESEESKTDLLNRLKSTYEVEIKYMNEYILRLKRQNTNHYLTPDEAKNENFLREEIKNLYEKLRHEQKINLQLTEKIDQFNYEKANLIRFKDEKPIAKTFIPEITLNSKEVLESIKKSFIDKYTESLAFYTKELRKAEEKLDRIDVSAHKAHNELKVLKKLFVVKYKENYNEKMISSKDLEQKLVTMENENSELIKIIKNLEKDVKFYQEENIKQREIIKEMADEVEIERNTLAAISKIKDNEGGSLELEKENTSIKSCLSSYEEKKEKLIQKCLKCEEHNEKNAFLEKKINKLDTENIKLQHEICKLQEDNQNLEAITEKMQDLLMFGNYSGNKNEDFVVNEKIYNLEEQINKLTRENKYLQEEVQQKTKELSEIKQKIDNNIYKDNSHPGLVIELQSIKKENSFLKLKSESLQDIKIKFLELVKLLADKENLEEEIVNVSTKNEGEDEGKHVSAYTQLRNELVGKTNRVKEIVKCFLSLN